ncbi:MAG TPA: DUF3999 family protein [Gemmatimonadaceae bacterium]|nr:DUF3999 family protein [Gemmatimonadaceae bacterium]
MNRFALGLALGIAVAGPLAAQQAERVVVPGGAGPNKLAFDATVLAAVQPFRVTDVAASEGRVAVASGGAGDLRLFDKANREVPYLLITPRVEAQWRAARLLRITPTKLSSGFEADFETALMVDRVRMEGLPAPFLKRVQIEGSGDRAHWTVLVPDGTLFDLPNDGLALTALDIPAGSYRYLRLTWDDRASRRMPLPRQVEARVASATRGPAPLRTPVAVERRPSEPGKSRFRIRLPGAHLPIVALELNVGGGNVLRTARITEGRLEGSTVVPAELGTATLRRSVRDGLAAAELRIPITPPSESQLELAVDDGNNPPLDVTGATAVFATLPFVFFESTGDTLVARFGSDRLTAPKYDLEAERDRVPSLALATAHWGASREVTVATADTTVAMPTAGATIDPEHFRYARSIAPGTAGLATLPLDAATLAHGSFADIRIATSDGHQVPFLVERLDEPLAVTLPSLERLTRSRDQASRSHYRIRLPYAGLPASRLVIRTDARVFEREVGLQILPNAEDDPRARSGPITIASTTWRHADPELPAPALSLELPPLRVSELSLVVDEGDNAPLPLREATLLLPAFRLRFFRDGHTPLTLLYGRPDLGTPRYDLALLAPRLLGAPAQDVAASAERETSNVTGVTPTIVFWCALALAVLALVVLIARLLRPGNGTPTTPAVPPSPTSSASPATGE